MGDSRVWPGVAAGALSGLLGALTFAAAHALLIVPIWSRMTSGLLFGIAAGAAAGWALTEIFPIASVSTARAAVMGAAFGAVLWLLVTPVTVADAVLRATGVAPRFELVAVGVALVLAVGAGAIFGWLRTHRRRATLAAAIATLSLTAAMAGPVPVSRSPRALAIFFAVLPATLLAGAVLGLLSSLIHRRA